MYIDLSSNPTKSHYRVILDETIEIIRDGENRDNPLFMNILNQLNDLKEQVVENKILKDWDDINERYTLGQIAIQMFDDDDEMQNRLCDIYGGAVHYGELKDS